MSVIVTLREGPGEIAEANFLKFLATNRHHAIAAHTKMPGQRNLQAKQIESDHSLTDRIVPTIAQTAKNPNPNAACVISTVMVALFISAEVRQTAANPS